MKQREVSARVFFLGEDEEYQQVLDTTMTYYAEDE